MMSVWFILFLVYLHKCINGYSDTSSPDKQHILDLHNQIRNTVASGNFMGNNGRYLPIATDMNQLLWDESLSQLASDINASSSQCDAIYPNTLPTTAQLDASLVTFTLPASAVSLGLNIAHTTTTTTTTQSSLDSLIAIWIKQGSFFHFDGMGVNADCADPSSDCTEFSQLVWSETRYVGCAYQQLECTRSSPALQSQSLVCLYYVAAGDASNEKPYSDGLEPCYYCDGDRTRQCEDDNALCGGCVDASYEIDLTRDADTCDNGLGVDLHDATATSFPSLAPTMNPAPSPTPAPSYPTQRCCACTQSTPGSGGCSADLICEQEICDVADHCCSDEWDEGCAAIATIACGGTSCCECTTPRQDGLTGCPNDVQCEAEMCSIHSASVGLDLRPCCTQGWDSLCAETAVITCEVVTRIHTAQPTISELKKVEMTRTPMEPSLSTTDLPTSALPTTYEPTVKPTQKPSHSTQKPTSKPTLNPTLKPTLKPTSKPTSKPTLNPTLNPTMKPTSKPTVTRTWSKTAKPTSKSKWKKKSRKSSSSSDSGSSETYSRAEVQDEVQHEQVLQVQSSSDDTFVGSIWWPWAVVAASIVFSVLVALCVCCVCKSKKWRSTGILHERVENESIDDDDNEGGENETADDDDKTRKTSTCNQDNAIMMSNDEHSVFIPCMLSK